MSDDPATRLRENATEIATTIVTGVWLAALLTGQGWWLGALLLGYIVVIPIVALLFGTEEDRREWWDDDWWGDWEDEDDAETAEVGETADAETTASADRAETNNRDALETLRERYARGELTDAQFEHKLERLLETDTIENADEWASERRRGERAREEYERDRRRDPEFEFDA
ncbi:SHOCT domain-containing protein [Natronobiforma cellulositropha]|uniref:SHOCT domain-containing protein n=1 Tax=Natronobiforma cellulositropha TaxID=1679076 RepID=UPI0021D56E77|nr:SHOCT domain-containing protein [Natronobiforma cellulositropha]